MDKKNLELKEMYAEAVNNQQKGNFETAENLYKKILKVNPNHINTQNNLGALFMQMGNNKKAETLFGILEKEFAFLTPIQQSWYFSYYRYELALFRFLHGDDDEALLYVEETINHYHAELDIVLGNAWLLKGMILDRMGNHHEAKQAYKACISLDNHSAAMIRAKQYLKSSYIN